MSNASCINKLVLDLRFPGETDGKVAMNAARDEFQNAILPELNKLLDLPWNETITIDHLELDLGSVTLHDLPEKLASLLGPAIKDAISGISMTKKKEPFRFESRLTILLFYLQYGLTRISPFPAHSFDPKEELLKTLNEGDELSLKTIGAFLNNPTTSPLQRLQSLNRLLYLLNIREKTILLGHIIRLGLAGQTNIDNETFNKIKEAQENKDVKSKSLEKRLNIAFYTMAGLYSHEKRISLDQSLLETSSKSDETAAAPAKTKSARTGLHGNSKDRDTVGPEISLSHLETLSEGKNGFIAGPSSTADIPDPFGAQERFIINNAGLVLTAPYLPRFFEFQGLVRNGEFISSRHQIRAVFILQKFVQPAGKFYENILLLNKLICGIPAGIAIELNQRLTKEEKAESEEFLSSLIENWPALRNTSTEGLREAFLRRKGSVEKMDNDFLVRVESKSHDILLSYLSWNFSLIKYPWNDYLIHVEWKQD